MADFVLFTVLIKACMRKLHAAFHSKRFKDGINRGMSSMPFCFLIFCLCVMFPTFSPVPTISWRREDGASFGRKVDVNKASGVLEIPYFQMEDVGVYECVAENSRGRNSVKGKLSFYG